MPNLIPLVLLLGGLLYGVYQVAISLEIPVRVTAEQAVREFYDALGYRLPNYRRMYCLLTTDAKQSAEFASFSGFRTYWRNQLARLATSPTWLEPLEFRVEGYKCRYSAEKTFATARYTVRVFPRGKVDSAEPLAEFHVKNAAVKGPDNQWYLNDGLLPEPNPPAPDTPGD